ncbi:MAG TPA: response regulator [Planctomycetota bacterium]|nr:response regulator [Planctomycetota bacterium]
MTEEPPDTRRRLPTRGTILLVEDAPVVRAYILAALARDGWSVLTASSAEEALRKALAHPDAIDVLVADVVLPQMNGGELADRLLELRPDTRVLFMSGTPEEEIYAKGLLRPGTPYLEKPFEPAVLLDALHALFS